MDKQRNQRLVLTFYSPAIRQFSIFSHNKLAQLYFFVQFEEGNFEEYTYIADLLEKTCISIKLSSSFVVLVLYI